MRRAADGPSAPAPRRCVMAKADARDYVSLECEACGSRNYRTSKRIKGSTYKVNIKKYCRRCRKHVLHKEKRK